MSIKELALDLAHVLDNKKARDINIINIAEKSSFADYFVNATAGSERQMKALLSDVEDRAYELGVEEKGAEGKEGSGWILVDFGDVIVNIFTTESRDKYSIDKIWGDCEIENIGEENID